jgi:hypothetical protein
MFRAPVTRHSFRRSESVKEGKKLVIRLETIACLAVVRRESGQRGFLQGEMSVQIDLGGVDGFVPQPQCDDGAFDAGLEELHGRAVPETVRRDPLLLQGRHSLAGDRHVFADEILDGIDAEPATMDVWEKCLGTAPARLPQPLLQRGDGRGGQRRAPSGSKFAPLYPSRREDRRVTTTSLVDVGG